MKVIKAKHLGMCFGVRDAIDLVRRSQQRAPVTILGGLVHNQFVVESLKRDGIAISDDVGGVRTQNVMITAHGASEKRIASVREQGFRVTEATCPLVRFAHDSLKRLVGEGYHPVVIGKRGHVEVRGISEDFEACEIVISEEDILQMKPRAKFGIVAQTTQPISRVNYLVAQIQKRFCDSDVRLIDTVCQPTKQRQNSAEILARSCNVIVVIGGTNSNNTKELVNTCEQYGARVFHVQAAADLREKWFGESDIVGVTAGTSTPDELIDQVENWLNDLARILSNTHTHQPAGGLPRSVSSKP